MCSQREFPHVIGVISQRRLCNARNLFASAPRRYSDATRTACCSAETVIATSLIQQAMTAVNPAHSANIV
ncbi:hypothetical protein [Xanthomonas campestris]|jgi:hypothetical protein|uniref:hypothetical protein n=1 Tax=Xanthomonas campestris TaxID=339 RepID=UPI0009C00196|nr:hypothetical protein [Xanthomonas campestris]MCC5051632.1 hypothetical protein [Xanthomonas campestris pv. aberrans]MCF8868309.1 hypothetical protein [Xanthomonas campestris pv. campestris]MDM7670108.1 hypothetical protein [Xanthomonas campestris pv. campestris]MDM7673214.1 hypothetical protein [Xanthomonas campestris pv. campestris]MDM7685232.1 hypothetical protein [Xanthomonas campestris pv. campestris]